ncbi:MAG: Homoserine kinase, partial [uncultured Blastococcus sp.]
VRDGTAAGAGPRPGDQRESRPGLRLRGARAEPVRRPRVRCPGRGPPGGGHGRRGRDHAAHRQGAPRRPCLRSGLRGARLAPTRPARARGERDPAGAGDGLVGGRRRRRRARRLGAVPGRRGDRPRRGPSADRRTRGAPRQRRALPVRRCDAVLDDRRRRAGGAAGRAPRDPAARARPGPDAVHAPRPRTAPRAGAACGCRARSRPRRTAGARPDPRSVAAPRRHRGPAAPAAAGGRHAGDGRAGRPAARRGTRGRRLRCRPERPGPRGRFRRSGGARAHTHGLDGPPFGGRRQWGECGVRHFRGIVSI